MRRIEFVDEQNDVRVLVDLPEETFQKMKAEFGLAKLNSYIGALGQMAIFNSLNKGKK